MHPGSITDVPGLLVGHFTDPRRPTGCSVVLCEAGATAGVAVRGSAPGTRETDLLAPGNAVEQVHAVLLTGGSAFGLAAADGVMRWLEERGHGLRVGAACVPIVPAAVLFDLWVGDGRIRPDAAAGYSACDAASATSTAGSASAAQGNIGAGAGATVGKLFGAARAMKGGIGTASIRVGAITVGALVAVNAIGDVVDPTSGRIIAGALADDGRTPLDIRGAICSGRWPTSTPDALLAGMATTIGVIGTDARLTKAQANQLASVAHDGLARSINPVHTLSDGDTLFTLATGASGQAMHLSLLGTLAAEVTARAVINAVYFARGLTQPRVPSAFDLGMGQWPGTET